jgi:hypothetical protein
MVTHRNGFLINDENNRHISALFSSLKLLKIETFMAGEIPQKGSHRPNAPHLAGCLQLSRTGRSSHARSQPSVLSKRRESTYGPMQFPNPASDFHSPRGKGDTLPQANPLLSEREKVKSRRANLTSDHRHCSSSFVSLPPTPSAVVQPVSSQRIRLPTPIRRDQTMSDDSHLPEPLAERTRARAHF